MALPAVTMRKPKPRAVVRWPWDEVQLELHEISEIKAMAAQFPRGWNAILHKILGVDRVSFTAGGADGERATTFSEGKRWGGCTLRQVVTMRMPGPKLDETGPHAVPKGAPPES